LTAERRKRRRRKRATMKRGET